MLRAEAMVGLGGTRRACVEEDLVGLRLGVMDTQDSAVWRNGILGNRLTRAVAWKNDVKL